VLAGLVTAHRRPAPPYDAGPEAARLGATAMIDVSDGLLADLGHVAAASGVQVNVNRERLAPGAALRAAAESLLASAASPGTSAAYSTPPIPLSIPPAPPGPLARAGGEAASAAMALEWVLTGGEDHSLVAAFPLGTVLPGRWHVIGEVRAGAGVTVDGAPHDGPGGWQHFR
jgi:thiamine-monophosphate kinase